MIDRVEFVYKLLVEISPNFTTSMQLYSRYELIFKFCVQKVKRSKVKDHGEARWKAYLNYKPLVEISPNLLLRSVLFFSRPLSEGWPHHDVLSPFISVL